MPYALLIAGAVLVTASVRNKQSDLFRLLKGDFTGPNNFVFWFLAILAIGAIGYIPKLKPISQGFLVLVVIVLFIGDKNASFFPRFMAQIKSTESGGTVSPGGANSPIDFSLPQLPNLDQIFQL